MRTLYKIDAEPYGPAQARHIIANELSGRLPSSVLDDIKLMASELVAHGIVHGDGDQDMPVVLDLAVNGSIRCRVLDYGRGFAVRVQQQEYGGWGLRLVEELSDRWGVQSSPNHTEVWFERDRT
jgi:anti-sigma regulatory factor (Ser/Thr protein kinase)